MRGRIVTSASLALMVGLWITTVTARPVASTRTLLSAEALAPIESIVQDEAASGHIPGAVVLIGQEHRIVYRRAFGWRAVRPTPTPMTVDTIFDLASLTKVVATTTAVMQLAEQGSVRLDSPAAAYWPEFVSAGKSGITVRELLTHYSGLKADLDLDRPWSGYGAAMTRLLAERPVFPAGTRYLYSDENFEVLGEIVQRVSGLSLDRYCAQQIFQPLGMSETRFRPLPEQVNRIAPTSAARIGVVNDPTASRMGGVAGHAGLFSTADDLAIFGQMLLDGGTRDGARVLSAESIAQMARPQSPPAATPVRGLGWDIAPPLASNRDALGPAGSFGHTGFTGTMLWLDPASGTYVVILTNRTYPDGRGDAQPLRARILDVVSASLGAVAPAVIER
jgi:serine-type D-Ala-D-Ala carboxypeptidase